MGGLEAQLFEGGKRPELVDARGKQDVLCSFCSSNVL